MPRTPSRDRYIVPRGKRAVLLQCSDCPKRFKYPEHETWGRYPRRCLSCHTMAYGNRNDLRKSYKELRGLPDHHVPTATSTPTDTTITDSLKPKVVTHRIGKHVT